MAKIDDLLEEYRREALLRDRNLQVDYVRRWRRIEDVTQDKIQALIYELNATKAANNPIMDYQLHQLERYQSLLAQIQSEIFRFMRFADGNISGIQQAAAADGLDFGYQSLKLTFPDFGVFGSDQRLSIEAVQSMIGYSQNGMPLYELLVADYPKSIVQLTEALTRGVALGWNPRVTAKEMYGAMSWNLERAFTVARTEQMRALRTGQLAEYRNSDYAEQYERRASKSTRTCLACLLEDGRIYQINETMSDHPNGRCMFLVVPPWYKRERLTGKEYFLSLDQTIQKEIMGNERFDAWKRGEVPLEKMSRMHTHPIWGEAPVVVPMRELIAQPPTGVVS